MGFTVDLGGTARVATSIEMTTGNDFEVRDPTAYEIFGSNDGSSYTSVATESILCISDRLFTRAFDFANTKAYTFYRINYTAACDPSGGTGFASIQVSETQLFEIELGVNDNQLENAIFIAPNPNSGVFMLNYAGNESLQEAIIIDFGGKVLQQIDLRKFNAQQEILLEQASSGLYFIQIRTEYAFVMKRIVLK